MSVFISKALTLTVKLPFGFVSSFGLMIWDLFQQRSVAQIVNSIARGPNLPDVILGLVAINPNRR